MPFYYVINRVVTASGTANTQLDHLRLLTIANQQLAHICGLLVTAHQGAAVGAMRLRLVTFTTPSTVGSAATPDRRNALQPAAQTTAFTAPTVGTTQNQHVSIGCSVLGGTGGWFALNPNHALALLPNAGANGNADVISIAQIASTSIDYTLEFFEG